MKRLSILLVLLFAFPIICQTSKYKSLETHESIIKNAKRGDKKAQYKLGVMYNNGDGVTKNDKKAVKWYKKAAQKEHPKAQFNLGLMYNNGDSVQKDYKKAAELFEKAAEQGVVAAKYNLACLFLEGQGVRQSKRKAYDWFKEAAKQDYARAQYRLGIMYYTGEGVIRENFKMTAHWYKKAAQKGHVKAQCHLAYLYLYGLGINRDYKKAFELSQKAANQGNAFAQCILGSLYFKGKGVPKNYHKAISWYKKSAHQGEAFAQYSLGLMYGKGEGVIEDLTKAYKWILLAGKNGKDVTEIKNFLQQKMTREQTLRAKYLAKQFGLERKEDYHKNEEAGSDNAKCFGSGFFVSSNGHVVTAAHVVEKANEVEIFNQNFSTSAKVVYKDKSLDVAILKADKTKTPFLPIIPSSKVEVATEVFTLGFPQIQIQGSEPKYTKGSISSLSGFEGNRKLFQISVPVQPGNSGSPLLNFKGEVIGVVVARLNSVGILINKGSIPQNVNYAIKSSFVLPFLHTLPEFSLRNRTFPKKRAELISVVKEAVVGVVSY